VKETADPAIKWESDDGFYAGTRPKGSTLGTWLVRGWISRGIARIRLSGSGISVARLPGGKPEMEIPYLSIRDILVRNKWFRGDSLSSPVILVDWSRKGLPLHTGLSIGGGDEEARRWALEILARSPNRTNNEKRRQGAPPQSRL